jgi:hypothetical protein
MPASVVEEIRTDATSLYRFVDAVCGAAETPPSAYMAASQLFFDYIKQLGARTKDYLELFPTKLPTHPPFVKIYRQKLTIIRDCWSELHHYVKPAVDADTLNVPFALMEVFNRRLNELPRFNSVTFTVFHLQQLNYVQVKASWIRDLTAKLVSLIPGAQPFPVDLGLIGIPYSQRSSAFLNALIPHEMGHFVFQELQKWPELLPEAMNAVQSTFGADYPTLKPEDLAWCRDRMRSWTEEIFCDLFAISIVGPAYSLAYIELFDLVKMIYAGPAAAKEELEFSLSHPADAFRISEHVRLLTRLTWHDQLTSFDTHYKRVLEEVQKASGYVLAAHHHCAARTLQAFQSFAYRIMDVVVSLLGPLDSGVADFATYHGVVEEHLHRGIVPSTVFYNGVRVNPTPITILNTAYKVSLDSLDTLISSAWEQDPASVAVRAEWLRRLEQWTMKAFEDHRLLAYKKAGPV